MLNSVKGVGLEKIGKEGDDGPFKSSSWIFDKSVGKNGLGDLVIDSKNK